MNSNLINQNFQKIDINSSTSFYLVSFNYLLSYDPKVPIIQRCYDEERVEYFFQELKKYYQEKNELYNLNPIQLSELNNQFFILDGQHRFLAYKKLYFEYFTNNNMDFNIPLIYQFFNNSNDLKKSFINLNNQFITKGLILDEDVMDVATTLKNYIIENYKHHLSNTQKPKFPHINLDQFVDLLIKRFSNQSAENIINKLELTNKDIAKYLFDNDIGNYQNIKNKGGLFMVYLIHKKDEPENKDGRRKLPTALRRALWISKFGEDNLKGNCFVCNYKIDMHGFHCGHVLSVKNGGSDNIKNLECVCALCNLSMGTQNMMEFKQKYF